VRLGFGAAWMASTMVGVLAENELSEINQLFIKMEIVFI
jgi:hypothetical protein